MRKNISICLVSVRPGVPETQAHAVLARLFKGNEAKADRVLTRRDAALTQVASEGEGALFIDRLRELGLECRMEVNEDDDPFGDGGAGFTNLITCPHCGVRQEQVSNCCPHCRHPFDAESGPHIVATGRHQPETDSAVPPPEPTVHRFLPAATYSLGLLLVVGAIYFIGSERLRELAGFPETTSTQGTGGVSETTGDSPGSAVGMILQGVAGSLVNEPPRPTIYEVESGLNPYAERLKSLGVDTKKLAEAQGYKDGIRPDQVQDAINKTPGVGQAINNYVREPGGR